MCSLVLNTIVLGCTAVALFDSLVMITRPSSTQQRLSLVTFLVEDPPSSLRPFSFTTGTQMNLIQTTKDVENEKCWCL